jgi:hypothetical protein
LPDADRFKYTSSTVEQILVKKQAEQDANLIENDLVTFCSAMSIQLRTARTRNTFHPIKVTVSIDVLVGDTRRPAGHHVSKSVLDALELQGAGHT